MDFIPVPNVCMIELIYGHQNQTMENVLHYTGQNVSDPAILMGLAQNAFTQWAATWKTQQSNVLWLGTVRATSLEQQNSPSVEYIPTTGNAGTQSADPLPANCAALIQVLTAYRGRSYRGRIYIPGLCDNQATGSTLSETTKDALTNSFSYWDFLDVSGEPYGLCVVSRFHNKAPRVVGIHTDATGFSCGNYVVSQRRRLPGRGV